MDWPMELPQGWPTIEEVEKEDYVNALLLHTLFPEMRVEWRRNEHGNLFAGYYRGCNDRIVWDTVPDFCAGEQLWDAALPRFLEHNPMEHIVLDYDPTLRQHRANIEGLSIYSSEELYPWSNLVSAVDASLTRAVVLALANRLGVDRAQLTED